MRYPRPAARRSATPDAAGVSDADVFEAHHGPMFAMAYRMLGTITDAEDAVQDAWLRWSAASREDVADQRAYLARIVANTALNRLRSARARREAYIGPWLPEPLLTEAGPDPAERAELAESVSMAMLVVLESLTPDERAVFVLREVFGCAHAEIGAALGRSAAAVRQLAHRAREHVQARRPRFDVNWHQQREVVLKPVPGHLAALVGVHSICRGPNHRVASRLVLEYKAIGHRGDAVLFVKFHRLCGLGVRPSIEYPGSHQPYGPLDLVVGAAEGASRGVTIHHQAHEVVLPAHAKVDLTDLEFLGPEPHAHVFGLGEHVKDEFGGCIELLG